MASDFSSSITKIAVAQICQSVGYDGAQASALHTLCHVAALYLKAVAKSAACSANSCGRTHSNLFDIVIALEDLASAQGFPGASSTTPNSLMSSSLLKDIKKSVLHTDEVPCGQPLLRGDHHVEKGGHCRGGNLGHVPTWLPEMPVIRGKVVELVEKGEEILSRDFSGQNAVVNGEGKRKEERKGNGKGFELPQNRGKVRLEMGVRGGWGGALGRHNGTGGNENKKKIWQ